MKLIALSLLAGLPAAATLARLAATPPMGWNGAVRNARHAKMLEVRVSFCDFAAMQVCGHTTN
jgi:hypothetical protein